MLAHTSTPGLFDAPGNWLRGLQDEYAHRDSMTDVIVHSLSGGADRRIKSSDFVQNLCVFRGTVAIATSSSISMFSLDWQGQNQSCKSTAVILEPPPCRQMVLARQHVICCNAATMQSLDFDGQRWVPKHQDDSRCEDTRVVTRCQIFAERPCFGTWLGGTDDVHAC